MAPFDDLRLSDLVDIAIVASLTWLAMVWFRTSRARMALLGLSAVALLFVLAREMELQLTTWLLQGFFAVAALMLVVVFQDDLRRLFEGIAVWGLRRTAPHPPRDVERALVRVCDRLARCKVGALIVLPGREPLERHLDGGIHLDGRVSEAMLVSLFDPSTPGHDGAVIVRANRVTRFGVHLPLSTDYDGLGQLGTRHAAALGLSERSDALCLVVSEERGEVSVARGGRLARVETADALARILRGYISEVVGASSEGPGRDLLTRVASRWREGVASVAAALGMWYVAIPGTVVEELARPVPVTVANLPEGYELVSVEPEEVEVRFQGRRRDLYLAAAGNLSVTVDALLVQLGRRTFELTADAITHPDSLRALSISPQKVRLSVKKR